MKIIVPKQSIETRTYPPRGAFEVPFFFLAGPICGGGDWQTTMCKILEDIVGSCIIACPCRWTDEHPLADHFIRSKAGDGFFKDLLAWERYYLKLAGTHANGCIIFWLPYESIEDPHPGPEPYAMDTRGELGEWRVKMRTENARVVIGAEPLFLGLSQIKRNFERELGKYMPISGTMHSTAEAAVRMAVR